MKMFSASPRDDRQNLDLEMYSIDLCDFGDSSEMEIGEAGILIPSQTLLSITFIQRMFSQIFPRRSYALRALSFRSVWMAPVSLDA